MSKYNEVLQPFMQMMDAELHANSAKGDRPGWLSMTAEQCLLEIYYHVSKLQKAVRDGNGNRIKENAADVANMAMMLADICGALEMAQPSDGALTPEPFFYAMCGPDGKPHYQEYCVSAKAHHLEPDADGVTVIPVYRHAQDLTNEGAEPVALADAFGEWFKRNPYETLTHAHLGYMAFKAGAVWFAGQRTPKPICTCPSGDGSLRWPCLVHPPEVKALVLPERKGMDLHYDSIMPPYSMGWNACLDRVKELNS